MPTCPTGQPAIQTCSGPGTCPSSYFCYNNQGCCPIPPCSDGSQAVQPCTVGQSNTCPANYRCENGGCCPIPLPTCPNGAQIEFIYFSYIHFLKTLMRLSTQKIFKFGNKIREKFRPTSQRPLYPAWRMRCQRLLLCRFPRSTGLLPNSSLPRWDAKYPTLHWYWAGQLSSELRLC